MLDLGGVIAADIEASNGTAPAEPANLEALEAEAEQSFLAPAEPEPAAPAGEKEPVLVDDEGKPVSAKDVADYLYWKKMSRKNEDGKKAALTEAEQLAAELADLKQQFASIQRANSVGKVIAEYSLPEAAEQFLTGSTEAELKASAAKLVETFGVKRKVGRPANATPNPHQGQSPAPAKELSLGEIAGLH